jgi:protein involved in polysaccharide export with SLBB domain
MAAIRRMYSGLVLVSLLATACMYHLPAITGEQAEPSDAGDYRIGANDVLSVKFFYTPELNEDVSVRPDGKLSLQLVGEVAAAGHTPAEVSKDLATSYARFLAKPEVTVIVRSFGSQRAFVGGEVKAPGMVAVDGKTDLAGAVFQAGGALDTAELSTVVLLRRGASGREVYRVDLSDALEGAAPMPVLRAYDVVYVPKSVIAQVGMYVELYINKIIPRNGAFYAVYQIDQPGLGDAGAVQSSP